MSNPYVKKRGSSWVILQKGTRRVLSKHRTRSLAEASFRAMEAKRHTDRRSRRKRKR